MKRLLFLILAISILCSGCATLFDGTYTSVTAHSQSDQTGGAIVAVNYGQLCQAIRIMARNGAALGLIDVSGYDRDMVEQDMHDAVKNIMTNDPVAAYAVQNMTFVLKDTETQTAIQLKISYLHDRSELQQILYVDWMHEAEAAIASELEKSSQRIVLYIDQYEDTNFSAWVQQWVRENPQAVMETPTVTVNAYPSSGTAWLVELNFTYRHDRQTLRDMHQQVTQMFAFALRNVEGKEPYRHLYTFLTERFQTYQLEKTDTPAYSLLMEGKGDAESFALVYAALCRQAGVPCTVVTGTLNGEAHSWNQIYIDGQVRYVDLLAGEYLEMTANQMSGYE